MVNDSPVHVTTQRRHYVGKDGMERVYETHLLRRSFREDGKVRNETAANLSHLPAAAITAVRSVLAGRDLVDAASVVAHHGAGEQRRPHPHSVHGAAQTALRNNAQPRPPDPWKPRST